MSVVEKLICVLGCGFDVGRIIYRCDASMHNIYIIMLTVEQK